MNKDLSQHIPASDSAPCTIHYARVRPYSRTRRQQKHQLLLTFMNHTRKQRTAPVKPGLLHLLMSVFI